MTTEGSARFEERTVREGIEARPVVRMAFALLEVHEGEAGFVSAAVVRRFGE